MRRFLLLLAVLAALPATAHAEEETRRIEGAWPLVYWRKGEPSEFGMLGPLVQFRSEPGKSYSAVLPFFSMERDDKIRLLDIYALWPLIRWKQRGDRVNFHILPLVWHSHDLDSGGTVAFPLWWSGWEDRQTRKGLERRYHEVLFPFYWNLGKEPGYKSFNIWPLYGHREEGKTYDSYYFLWPLFWYFRDPARSEVGADFPWPLAGYRGRDRSYALWILPLLLLARSRLDSVTVVTPFVGHVQDERSSTTWALPLFFTHVTQKYRLTALALNLLVLESSRKTKALSLVWPLLSLRKDGEERSIRIAPLIWGEAAPERHWLLFLPLLYSRSNPRASDLAIFPLFYNQRRGAGDAAGGMTLLLPLFYDFRAPHSRLTVLFPLFGSLRLGEDHTRYIFPSILDIKRGDASYFHAWPLYGHHEVGDHYDRYYFLAPFFSYTSDRQKEEWQLDLFWPIFSYRRGKERESLRFLPFAWYERGLKGKTTVVFPIYWHWRDDESSHLYIAPFYGEQRRGETFLRQFFLGGAYIRTRDREKDLVRHDVLYPLITHEREGKTTRTAVRPIFWHESSPEKTRTVLVPFFYNRVEQGRRLFLSIPYSRGVVEGKSRWDNVLGLLYHRSQEGARTSQEILFPFIHTSSEPGGSNVEVRPFFWHERRGEEGHSMLLPFYLRFWGPGRDAVNFLPFYTRIERPNGRTTTSILGPLYMSEETPTTISQNFLWPLIYHYRGHGVNKWQVRPLFWYEGLAGEETRTVLFPIYWRYRSPKASHFHLWPLFGFAKWTRGQREYREVSTAWPFFSYKWGRDDGFRQLNLFFPLFRTEVDGEGATTWLFPLFFYDRDVTAGTVDTDVYIAPPLFYYGSSGERTQWNVLWKLLTYRSDENRRDFRFLFEIIRSRSDRETTLFRVFPLFSYYSDRERSEFSLLWTLFHYESDPDGIQFNLLHYLFRYEDSSERFLLELNPLFSIEKTERSTYFGLLGGLFSVESRATRTDVGLLYFIKF